MSSNREIYNIDKFVEKGTVIQLSTSGQDVIQIGPINLFFNERGDGILDLLEAVETLITRKNERRVIADANVALAAEIAKVARVELADF